MESHKGFIALVDISGYTNFVSGHNLDSSKDKKLLHNVCEAVNIKPPGDRGLML